jgi:N-acetylglucosaminyldiphosphoundecaprenol N-acetyl-beta-D-mannosaminyltransferase
MSSGALPAKQSILGVGVSATSYAHLTELCSMWVKHPLDRARYVTVTDAHGIVKGFFDASFREVLNHSDVTTPDGMPVVWAMRSFGVKDQTRVYGPDLMLSLCERAAKDAQRVFLYGARAETLETLAMRLTAMFPGLLICGTIAPPFRPLTPEEDALHVRQILESRADVLFVGLGTPKQEKWMLAHRDLLPGVVLFSVGAAFDFHAGRVQQAPKWMQSNGLEWFFRLTREPGRLWKRYAMVITLFPPLWVMQKLRILRFQ